MASAEEERAWIAGSRKGDPAAFESLIREYQRMIHSLTFRMTGSLVDAEDLAQEAFVRAYQQLDSFREESKFSTWLCRIAVNACLNWRKREGRRRDIHDEWMAENLGRPESSASNDGVDELSRQVQSALDRLPAKQRAAIVLTIYQEMSHAEAARVAGCTEATISWRLFAARGKLKRWLNRPQARS
jgi:RNA polymerase sigma-70 factor, ECF subfamily